MNGIHVDIVREWCVFPPRNKVCLRQRGLIYTENKPLGRLCKMCNPFFYEFRVILSANVFQFVCYIANLFTTEAVH